VDSAKTQGSTFRAKVDVVEWLGNEAFAYIPFEAPPEVQQQLAQLERDLDGESLRTQLVVSLDSASRIKEGDEAEIYVDSSHMHLFDPATGENLTLDRSNAGTVPSNTSTEAVAEEQDAVATPAEQEGASQSNA
jgi:multiple sugar transport system ATP-binding protein